MRDLTPGHPGWFRDVRRILDITEVTPGIPLPHISKDRAVFFFAGICHAEDAVQMLRDAETILGYAFKVTFTPRRTKAGSTEHHILTAMLPSGLMIDLVALAEHIDSQPAPAGEHELSRAAA